MKNAFVVFAAVAAVPLAASQDYGSCTATNGQVGECISVTECQNAGGSRSEPNLCPGDATIQCCTSGDDAPEPCGAPDINAASLDLIAEFEGFVDSPYADPVGLITVGYGHLCGDDACSEVSSQYGPFPMTEAEGSDLLQSDAEAKTSCVAAAVNVPLNDNQYGALVSFTFNLGCGTFESSTLLARLNGGEDPNTVAGQEIPRFKFADGMELPGLVRRRAAEVDLFQTPSDVAALPAC